MWKKKKVEQEINCFEGYRYLRSKLYKNPVCISKTVELHHFQEALAVAPAPYLIGFSGGGDLDALAA